MKDKLVSITTFMSELEKKKWKHFFRKTVFYPDQIISHKEIFGTQDYCYSDDETRYWVWEFDQYRVRVSNYTGISLDVNPDLNEEQALGKWKEYMDKWEDATSDFKDFSKKHKDGKEDD